MGGGTKNPGVPPYFQAGHREWQELKGGKSDKGGHFKCLLHRSQGKLVWEGDSFPQEPLGCQVSGEDEGKTEGMPVWEKVDLWEVDL